MKKIFFFLIVFLLCSVLFSSKAGAVSFNDIKNAGLGTIGTQAFGSEAPQNSVQEIIAQIIKYLLSFLGMIFLILVLYGGYLWMTAAGNEDQVAKAKTIITNGVMGLIIILAAYAITFFVLRVVTEVTQG